jgi:hypothetical protein
MNGEPPFAAAANGVINAGCTLVRPGDARQPQPPGIDLESAEFFFQRDANRLVSAQRSGSGIMSAYVWQDGRLLGFDAVEWMTWLAAVTGIALLTLAI